MKFIDLSHPMSNDMSTYPTDPETIYDLSEGQNLISYIGNDNLYIWFFKFSI